MIEGIVLAAGDSRRMGSPKALLPFGETSFVEAVCRTMIDAGVDRVVVVVGADAEKIRSEIEPGLCTVAVNPRPSDGMISSLRVGLREMDPQTGAVVVALVDQPAIPTQVVRDVLSAWEASAVDVVVPQFEGRRGHPVLLSRRIWHLCFEGPLEKGLHWVTHHARVTVTEVKVESQAVTVDIDTPDEYRLFLGGTDD